MSNFKNRFISVLLGYIIRMENDVFHRDSRLSLSKIPDDYTSTFEVDEAKTGYGLMDPK